MIQVSRWQRWLVGGCCLAVGALSGAALSGQPVAQAESGDDRPPPVAVAAARDRATVLHGVYSATLDVMHDRYFHGERATVPARALEDVFAEVSREAQIDARWISVNTRPMSIGHEPKGDFEKQAVKEIAAGKNSFEKVAEGVYRRAAAIRLHDSCVNCHVGFLADATKTPRFAGLIISMPVKDE
jgi:hypothetical protein